MKSFYFCLYSVSYRKGYERSLEDSFKLMQKIQKNLDNKKILNQTAITKIVKEIVNNEDKLIDDIFSTISVKKESAKIYENITNNGIDFKSIIHTNKVDGVAFWIPVVYNIINTECNLIIYASEPFYDPRTIGSEDNTNVLYEYNKESNKQSFMIIDNKESIVIKDEAPNINDPSDIVSKSIYNDLNQLLIDTNTDKTKMLNDLDLSKSVNLDTLYRSSISTSILSKIADYLGYELKVNFVKKGECNETKST